MIQLQAGNAFAIGQQGRLGKLAELGAIDKGFQNVLLNVEVVIHDGSKLLSQYGKMFDGFVDGVVIDIIGGRFGPQQEVIADILFDEAMAIVTTNDGVG